MKKKIGILSFAVLLVLSVTLTGCSSSPATKVKLSPDDPVSLEVWHYYNGPQKESFDEMVAEFNDTVGMETVSYTHLDVYKRQVHGGGYPVELY